jgi:hypothetical protein
LRRCAHADWAWAEAGREGTDHPRPLSGETAQRLDKNEDGKFSEIEFPEEIRNSPG